MWHYSSQEIHKTVIKELLQIDIFHIYILLDLCLCLFARGVKSLIQDICLNRLKDISYEKQMILNLLVK